MVRDKKYDWPDVLVVGEVKKTGEQLKALLLQVASAVRNVFAFQPTRHFVHSFTLAGSTLKSWVFDRSGPYSSEEFDIPQEPEKFIQVFFGYLLMDKKELGINTFIEKENGQHFVTFSMDTPHGRERKLELDAEPIARQKAIVCRGTTCFLSKSTSAKDYDSVVKMSWTSDLRPPETDLLKKANERGVKGLAKLIAYQEEITSIRELRNGLTFLEPHKFRDVSGNDSVSLSQSLAFTQSSRQFHGLSIATNENEKRPIDTESKVSKRPRFNSHVFQEGQNEVNITYAVQEPQGTSLLPKQEQETYPNRILRALAISPAGCSSLLSSITSALIMMDTVHSGSDS